MGIDSFFDYPTESESVQPDELTFLRQWSDRKWRRLLDFATRRPFRAGEVVIQQGDTDRTFSIIIEGTLEVIIPSERGKKPHRVFTYTGGAVIGEQAFIDGSPRSATVRALTDGELLQFTVDDFEVFSAKHPELAREALFELARLLSVKLRRANEFISRWVK